MISSTTFDGFAKPNIGLGDSPDAKLDLNLFDMLFSIPVAVPQVAVTGADVLPTGWPILKAPARSGSAASFLPETAENSASFKGGRFDEMNLEHGSFFDKKQLLSTIPVKVSPQSLPAKKDKGIELPPELSLADNGDILDILRANFTQPVNVPPPFSNSEITSKEFTTPQSQSRLMVNTPATPIMASLNHENDLPLEFHPNEIQNRTTVSLPSIKAGDNLPSEIHLLEIPDLMPVSLSPVSDGDSLPPQFRQQVITDATPITPQLFNERENLQSEFHQLEMQTETLPSQPPVKDGIRTLLELRQTEIPVETISLLPPVNDGKKLPAGFQHFNITDAQLIEPKTISQGDGLTQDFLRLRDKSVELPISLPMIKSVADPGPVFHKPESQITKTPRLPVVNDQLQNPGLQIFAGDSPHIFEASVGVSFGSTKTFEPAVSTDLPKLLKDFSIAARADNSSRTTFSGDPAPDQKIVQQIRQIFAGENGQNLDKPLAEIVKPGKQGEFADQVTELTFGSSIKSAAQPQPIAESRQIETRSSEKILDQIEPHVIDLAAITQNGKEKRTLKMRLTPADLGAVEITVVKNSDGKINAHFLTESHETRQILTESLVQLRDSLERSGLQVGDLEISCASFASGGNEGRSERPKEFGTAEHQTAGTTNFDGISKNEDEKQNRLVNLRA